MPHYVDAFVLAVPRANLDAYREMAQRCGQIWREHGALDYAEFIADDVQPGKVTSFPQSVDLKPDEVVIFSTIAYHSREQRNEVNAKVMADPRLKDMNPQTMPFDAMRMFWGGFKMFVQA